MTDIERKEYVNYISTGKGCYKSWLPADRPFIGDTPKGSYVVREWKEGFFEKAHNYANDCPIEDFGIMSNEGLSVLHYFSIYNLYEEVEILLKRGADPNIAGVATSDEDKHEGVTPFHFACYHGNLEMAKLLVSYGADTSLCDARGNNAYHYLEGTLDLKYDTMSSVNYYSSDALFGAAKRKIIKLIKGADINQMNDDGYTPLQLLVYGGCYSNQHNMCRFFVKDFVKLGADLTVRDIEGNTPLMLAAMHGQITAVEAMVRDKSILDLQNDEGNTALHLLMGGKGDIAIAYLLISAGADCNIPNDYEVTALQFLTNEDKYSNAERMKKFIFVRKRRNLQMIFDLFHELHYGGVNWASENDDRYGVCMSLVRVIMKKADPDDDGELKLILEIIRDTPAANRRMILEAIVDAGIDINYEFPYYEAKSTTLGLSLIDDMWWCDPEIVPALKAAGMDIDAEQPTGYTLAYYLVGGMENSYGMKRGDWDKKTINENIIKGLSHISAESMSTVCKNGKSAAHFAICHNLDILEYMLERGIDVNVPMIVNKRGGAKTEGDTLLHIAMRSDNVELVRKLLEAGADETITNEDNELPIHCAYNAAKKEHFTELLDLFNDIDTPDFSNGKTLFMMVVGNDPEKEIVEYFIKRGVDINHRDNDGNSPLLIMVRNNCGFEAVKILVEAHADVNIQNREGNTALFIALKKKSFETAMYLLENGADFKIKNKEGETALGYAVEKGLSLFVEKMTLIEATKPKKKRVRTKKTRKISVWMGNFESSRNLGDYKAEFDWYGNLIAAEFTSNFGLSCNNLEKIHISYNDTETKPYYKDVQSLLKYFGIDKENIPQFEKLLEGDKLDKFNSIVMMYDCDYNGEVRNDGKTEFIGCVDTIYYGYRYVGDEAKPKQKVSLWLGDFECYDDLERYILSCGVFSDFKDNYGFKRDQHGEIRKRWCSNRSGSVTVTEFLSCFKDEEELIPAVEKLLEGRNLSRYNSVILVYDYEYLGKVSTDDKTDYMGCVYI